ncbi:MAG: DNA mismatch repair protein MutL, partial [Clostridiales bacterium]
TLLRLVVEQLTVNRGDVAALRREKLFQEACKQAIKANRRLNFQDITALFRDLDACTQPFTCPHGRPVIIKLDYREIRKRFLRGSI